MSYLEHPLTVLMRAGLLRSLLSEVVSLTVKQKHAKRHFHPSAPSLLPILWLCEKWADFGDASVPVQWDVLVWGRVLSRHEGLGCFCPVMWRWAWLQGGAWARAGVGGRVGGRGADTQSSTRLEPVTWHHICPSTSMRPTLPLPPLPLSSVCFVLPLHAVPVLKVLAVPLLPPFIRQQPLN